MHPGCLSCLKAMILIRVVSGTLSRVALVSVGVCVSKVSVSVSRTVVFIAAVHIMPRLHSNSIVLHTIVNVYTTILSRLMIAAASLGWRVSL